MSDARDDSCSSGGSGGNEFEKYIREEDAMREQRGSRSTLSTVGRLLEKRSRSIHQYKILLPLAFNYGSNLEGSLGNSEALLMSPKFK